MCFICNFKTQPDDAKASAHASPRWQARRAFMLAAGATAAGSALAQVDVGSSSGLRKLVPAETLETSARQQYSQVLAEARSKGALAPDGSYPPGSLNQLVAARVLALREIRKTYALPPEKKAHTKEEPV